MMPVSGWLHALAGIRQEMEQLMQEISSGPGRAEGRQSLWNALGDWVKSVKELEDRLTALSQNGWNPASWDQVEAAPINQRLTGFQSSADERDWAPLLLRISEQTEHVRNTLHDLSKGEGRDDWISVKQRVLQIENRLAGLTNRLHGTVFTSFLPLQENIEFDHRGERIVIDGPGDDWPNVLTAEQGQFD
ncbi:hypothetical protein JIR001_04670 [Polycladomyces abyssicola]|uniref:Uncharacterized protein n=1 Tax=Polycladomyces abyssicola TaxID=1125966 RepID=A0A8D5ZJM9_9BACL|nr:hypothetical protein [Polycladomyces abyssicola]BCU80684.1 hypothetical protein JIR001_04670 [Polycladomyces abyssicola]